MTPRLSVFYGILYRVMVIALLLGGGAAAWARHPEAGQMDAVQRLARQLALDTGLLAETAGAAGTRAGDLSAQAIQSFQALHQAAERFQRQVGDYYQNPDHTEADYIALRDDYRQARIYFDVVPGSAPVQESLQRTRDAMRGLIDYYSDTQGPAGYDPGVVRQTAAQILAIAGRLEARAATQHRSGRVSQDAVTLMDRVNAAAHLFYNQVTQYNAEPGRIDEEYDRLVQRLLDARSYMASFTMDFQDEYGALWSLTQSVNYISPGAAVGGPPYSSRPFKR